MGTSACLQGAGHAVGLGVAEVIAVVHPREVCPGQVDLLVAEDQFGPLDAQEVCAVSDSGGHGDKEEDGDDGVDSAGQHCDATEPFSLDMGYHQITLYSIQFEQ